MIAVARFPAKAGTHLWTMFDGWGGLGMQYGGQAEIWTPAFAGERNS
jgi:hypothetical protein